jgi:hypothetical protein
MATAIMLLATLACTGLVAVGRNLTAAEKAQPVFNLPETQHDAVRARARPRADDPVVPEPDANQPAKNRRAATPPEDPESSKRSQSMTLEEAARTMVNKTATVEFEVRSSTMSWTTGFGNPDPWVIHLVPRTGLKDGSEFEVCLTSRAATQIRNLGLIGDPRRDGADYFRDRIVRVTGKVEAWPERERKGTHYRLCAFDLDHVLVMPRRSDPVPPAKDSNTRSNAPRPLTVSVSLHENRVPVRARFQVDVRVKNTSTSDQSFRVANGGWEQHWTISTDRLYWEPRPVFRDFIETVTLKPGEFYSKTGTMLVAKGTPPQDLVFKLGFVPEGKKEVLWSDEVTLTLLPNGE